MAPRVIWLRRGIFLYAPALSPSAFGRGLLDHSANQASAMLRSVGRSISGRQPSGGAHVLRLPDQSAGM
jgi:hypothetical protein